MMLIVLNILVGLFFSACSNLDHNSEQGLSSKTHFPEETSLSASNETSRPRTYTGAGFSSPGVKAAYKEFLARRTDANKPIYFVLKGFLGETELSKSASTSAVEMKWTFLAESQDIVDQLADSAIPHVDKSNANFDQISFEQIKGCRSYSMIKINGAKDYTVQGTCISHPSISIPVGFNNKVFLNGKLIHDMSRQ